MPHGEWATPLCNILIAPPEEREQCLFSKRRKATTILLKDYQTPKAGGQQFQTIGTWNPPPGYEMNGLQWWPDPLNCYTLAPVVEPAHTKITYWYEQPILTPYQAGDSSVANATEFQVVNSNSLIGVSDVKTRLPDGTPRTNFGALARVRQNQMVELSTRRVAWGTLDDSVNLPARPCFRFEFSRYEPDNQNAATAATLPCGRCSTDEHPITIGQPHLMIEFGNTWKIVFDFNAQEIVLEKMWNVGTQGAPNNLWFKVMTIGGSNNPVARQMWQNQLIQLDVMHIGSHLVLAFGGDYNHPFVISPWHSMTVKGIVRYVGDGMALAGDKWKPFFRTPAAPFIVHACSCTPTWSVSPITWAPNGYVSVKVKASEGTNGVLDPTSRLLLTMPPSLASVQDPNAACARMIDTLGLAGGIGDYGSWHWTQDTTETAHVQFFLARSQPDHCSESPMLFGVNLLWVLGWTSHLGEPNWATATDYRDATVRVVESSAEPLIGGIDSCEVTLEKVALDSAYPGWEATIKRYSPIRVYMGWEEADFTDAAILRPDLYNADFCRSFDGHYATVLRFEGIVVDVQKVQHPGEDNLQVKLVCADWSALLAEPAGLIGSWYPPDFIYPARAADKPGHGGSEVYGFDVLNKLLQGELGPRVANRLRVFRHRNAANAISDYDLHLGYFAREGHAPQNGGDPLFQTRYLGNVYQWIIEFAKFDCNLYFFRQGVPFYADYFTFIQGQDDSGPLFDGAGGTASPVKTVDVYFLESADTVTTIEQRNREVTPVAQSEERTAEAINAVWVWTTGDNAALLPGASFVAYDWPSLTDSTAVNYTAGVEHSLPFAGMQYQTTHGTDPNDQPLGALVANQTMARFMGRKPIRGMLQMKGQPDLFWGDRLPVHGGDVGLDGINVRPIQTKSVAEWQPGQKAGPYTTTLIVAAEYSGITMAP